MYAFADGRQQDDGRDAHRDAERRQHAPQPMRPQRTRCEAKEIAGQHRFTCAKALKPVPGAPPAGLDLKSQVEAVERQAILRALEASGGNRRQAASLLGISLRTLFYKMRRLPVH